MTFIFPISFILVVIFPISLIYIPKCKGKCSLPKSQIKALLSNPGVIHSVPTAFMNAVGTEWITPGLPNAVGTEWITPGLPNHECSGYRIDHAWVTES